MAGGCADCAGVEEGEGDTSRSCCPTAELRPHTREEGGLTDELDNQVITNSENNFISELPKQRLIGDEFYGDDELSTRSDKSPHSDHSDLSASSCGAVDPRNETSALDENVSDNSLGLAEPVESIERLDIENHAVPKKVEKLDKPDEQDSPTLLSNLTTSDPEIQDQRTDPDLPLQTGEPGEITGDWQTEPAETESLQSVDNNKDTTEPSLDPEPDQAGTGEPTEENCIEEPLLGKHIEPAPEFQDKVSEALYSIFKDRIELQNSLKQEEELFSTFEESFEGDQSELLDRCSLVIRHTGSSSGGGSVKAATLFSGGAGLFLAKSGSYREFFQSSEVAVAALESLREPGGIHQDIFSDGLGNISQEVRLYNGVADLHQLLSVSQIMTASTQAPLENELDSSLVKIEPEDLTGSRQRHHTESSLPLDVTCKNMGIISSPDEDSIILSPEDLPLAPGFPSTTLSSYDSPSFSSPYTGSENRIYDSPYRDEGLYDGYRAPNSSYFVSGSGTPGLSVDLPSPDSGIGPDQITPREIVNESFDYSTQNILEQNTIRRPWHDYGRANSETEKVQIPKVYSPYGFKYYLDAATSSSVRREDDKVTYINKGQFYGVTLEYIRDPDYQLKSPTVKSIIMLVFREGKSQEEEIKAWQFWHQRQHSIKQRIIDVDTKNSHGLVGHIEELSHNAIAVYWNPLESFAKVNLAVQCLSTDFSTQKGVKGLPLHIQIDTLEDPRQEVGSPAVHRGYCQVKIFCDKGAERKLRDEERRAAKRRMTPSGKRRLDEMYHETFERSDFYSMSDLNKSPTLFTPPEDPDKATQLCQDFPSFYNRPLDGVKPALNGDILPSLHIPVSGPALGCDQLTRTEKTVLVSNPFHEKPKRARLVPPSNERIMIYVRQETEDVYTPLHLVPPTVPGLIASIENKYKINATNIRFIYRKNRDGIVAKIDDDMLRHYCNEDVFLMQVMVTEGPGGEDTMVYDITLSEILAAMEH